MMMRSGDDAVAAMMALGNFTSGVDGSRAHSAKHRQEKGTLSFDMVTGLFRACATLSSVRHHPAAERDGVAAQPRPCAQRRGGFGGARALVGVARALGASGTLAVRVVRVNMA